MIWYNWSDAYTTANSITYTITSSNVTSNKIWVNWVQDSTGSGYIDYQPQSVQVRHAPVNQEAIRRVRQAEQEESNRRAAEHRRATAKATKLLHLCLNERQRRQLEQHQCFEVISNDGTVRYLLYHGRSANVYRLDAQGRVVKRFCAHPAMMVPDADTLLAQKLMLETNPAEFERIANSHPLDDRGHRLAGLLLAA